MPSPSRIFWRRLLRHPSGVVGFALLLLILMMAFLADLVYPQGPWGISAAPRIWPTFQAAYPLGTDVLGRDLAAGIFYGARVSLLVGFASMALAVFIGIIVGAFGGYYGGRLDEVLMRLTDATQTIPSFLAAMAIVGSFGSSLATIILAIAFASWPMIARLVRVEFLRLRSMDFVYACQIIGMSNFRVMFFRILPNCLAPVIVSASILVASAIVIEASLSFLGLGDQNVLSWGSIIGSGRTVLGTAWYITALPALALVLTVTSLNLIGDALNDIFNPRQRVG